MTVEVQHGYGLRNLSLIFDNKDCKMEVFQVANNGVEEVENCDSIWKFGTKELV